MSHQIHMNHRIEQTTPHELLDNLLGKLRHLLAQLGSDGGLLTPSIYETAQALRFATDGTTTESVVEWLLQQQQPDGGWGDKAAPLYRAVPTLAAILALAERAPGNMRIRCANTAGLEVFRSMASYWQPPLADDIPIAAELILPRLLDEAERLGLSVSTDSFDSLRQLGQQRRQMLARIRPTAATPPLHSWEAWGHEADCNLIDDSGGVGHSPAATAWWLHLAHGHYRLKRAGRGARHYLANASRDTLGAAPGIQPPAWPLHCFETAFVLHVLLMADLLREPALADIVASLVERLATVVGNRGLGFSESFLPDGDDTAAAVAVLAAMGRRGHAVALKPFQAEDHFTAYPFELHHAPTVTTRGAVALTLCGHENQPWLRALEASQLPDGRWVGDKWNRSWLYTTAVVLHLFSLVRDQAPAVAALRALVAYQHRDGGWGSGDVSSVQETAYAVLALNTQRHASCWNEASDAAWRRARDFLLRYSEGERSEVERLWIHKELYQPLRIDQTFLLSALLVVLRTELISA